MTEMDVNVVSEIEEQRPGNDKNTKINRKRIQSAQYKRVFDTISDSPKLNRLLYQLAKQTLKRRSGSSFEEMYWISPESLSVIAEERYPKEEKSIHYSKKTRKIISRNKDLITIHSHPDSFPPSIADFNSNFVNGYSVGLVACHDGSVYMYRSNQEIDSNYYELVVASYIKDGYNDREAQIEAIKDLMRNFDIDFKEVAY